MDENQFRKNVTIPHLFDDWQRAHRRMMTREIHSTRKLRVIAPPNQPNWWRRTKKKIEGYILDSITAITVILFMWSERNGKK